MNAEQLLDLLDRNRLLAPDLIEGLRIRIADLPDTVAASDFAQRLVENGLLSSSQAEMALQHLERGSMDLPHPIKEIPTPAAGPVKTFSKPIAPPPAPLKKEPMMPKNPVPKVERPSGSEPPFPTRMPKDRFDPKRFSVKKKASNPWDSKLILFGAGGLIVLFLLGFFLFGSLFRQSADSLFSQADHAWQSGEYQEANRGYTEFLNSWPNHSLASTAKIRRALARIRVLVDAKSDWSKSLETAVTEIESVRNEPDFFEEANAELAELLPAIAEGLAAEAQEQTSILHAEQAEKTIKLIDEYLPRSLRPVEKLVEVQYRIDRVRRLLVQDDMLHEAKLELERKISGDRFDARQVELCYDMIGSILKDQPDLAVHPAMLDMLKAVSEAESRAVTPLAAEQVLVGVAAPMDKPAEAGEVVVLFQQTEKSRLNLDDGLVTYQFTGNAVFGLKATDGTPLWKRTVGETFPGSVGFETVLPLPEAGSHPKPGVLLTDSRKWSLEQLDGRTGRVLWRLPIGEPFHLSEVTTDTRRACIALATQSGKLFTVFFGSDGGEPANEVHGLQLPQSLASSPLVDVSGNRIYQFADRNTLFTLPLRTDGTTKYASRYFGQQPSTIRVPPFRFGPYLIVLRQQDTRSGVMDVFSMEKGVVQSIPLRGLVDTPPAVNENYLAVASDSGEARLFELSDDPKSPLLSIASGSVGDQSRGLVRSVILSGKSVWIADRQLMRFETQPAQSRLLPQESVRKDIITVTPPRQLGTVLFHAFRDPGLGGVRVAAVSLETASVFWEVEIVEPIVLEPRKIDENVFRVFTSSGKTYRIELTDEKRRFLGTPVSQLPRGIFGANSLGNVTPLEDGFEAWVPRLDRTKEIAASNRTVMIYDPRAAEATRYRSLMLPAALAAEPTALDGKLLAPLTDGQIVLFEPRSGTSVATPYTASLSSQKPSAWSEPVIFGDGEFLIFDGTSDGQARYNLHRIALQPDGNAWKFVRKDGISFGSRPASPIRVAAGTAVFVDRENLLQIARLGEMTGSLQAEKPEPLGAACIWGPHAVGDTFLLATADGRLHSLTAGLKRISVASPIPVGKPVVESDGIVLVSATGRLWKVGATDLNTTFSIETGVSTQVGTYRSGNAWILSGNDGSVYTVITSK